MHDMFRLDTFLDKPDFFTEAVFTAGREKMAPIVECFRNIQNELNMQTKDNVRGRYEFNPNTFIKNNLWKELEFKLCDIFGFKNVSIQHLIEEYQGNGKFDTGILNAYTYPTWRYPIDGLVTENGFYDKTKSIELTVVLFLGVFKVMTPEELTALFLHELGHNVDPALVDIKFIATNKVSDYLAGDESSTNARIRDLESSEPSFMDIFKAILLLLFVMTGVGAMVFLIYQFLKTLFTNEDSLIESIRKAIADNTKAFNMSTSTEAFADNFARMYGFGTDLISALNKIEEFYENEDELGEKKSFFYLEKARQGEIAEIVKMCMEDVHNTNIARAIALVKEYEKELQDPNMPAKVKKNLQDDMLSLQKVIDAYVDHKDDFTKRLRTAMYEELLKKNPSPETPPQEEPPVEEIPAT
nr:MAG TPA: peptidase [Caudoviricetes sp.]